MKFTLSWLKDHLETDCCLEQIVARLTHIGLEVESVDTRQNLKPFLIAKILTAKKHPDADKLQILTVDIGQKDVIQVVCGAPNARAGLLGVFAPPGTYIPSSNITLSVGKIRGIESYGMMCSEHELLLSNEHDGIIELSNDAPIGQNFSLWAGLDDPIIDISLTPNRADCASVRGIAKDLAASSLGTLKPLIIPEINHEDAPSLEVKLHLDNNPLFCRGFAWCELTNIKNKASPDWLQKRLLAIGLRPINAAVDVTNYLTHDLGRPLHVFDRHKLKGDLIVRCARDDEQISSLDGKTYSLNPSICVIADDKTIQSIAGIMGGRESCCDKDSTSIVLESALWDPLNIAMTGRSLGINSDARYRFERGVDPLFMKDGLKYAAAMIQKFTGGTISACKDTGFVTPSQEQIEFPFSEVKRLTSLDVKKSEMIDILTKLGFLVKVYDESAKITVPSWRPDIQNKADITEEIMRIFGIDKIKPQALSIDVGIRPPVLTNLQNRSRRVKRVLSSRAMLEAVTYSFISHDAAEIFGGGLEKLQLLNPIASDMSDLRPSLLPNLLHAGQKNTDRGFPDSALFEVSDVFNNIGQKRVAAGVRRGSAQITGSGRFWSGNAPDVDFFTAKADALSVLQACGLSSEKVQIVKEAPDWFHPGRSGALKLGPKTILGYFGELHPLVKERLRLTGHICAFEIFLEAIPEPRRKETHTKPALNLSPFQALSRDFAFIVDDHVEVSTLLKAVKSVNKNLITDVNVFDIFRDKSLGEAKKSIAIEVKIQPIERTLNEKDLDQFMTNIISQVEKMTGGKLRD